MKSEDGNRFIGVLLFDTITTLKEFEQICHDILKRGFKLELTLRRELGVKSYPEGCNIQVLISKS